MWTKEQPTRPGIYWALIADYAGFLDMYLLDVRPGDVCALECYEFGDESWIHIEIPELWWSEPVVAPAPP